MTSIAEVRLCLGATLLVAEQSDPRDNRLAEARPVSSPRRRVAFNGPVYEA
jgi:hypothetical protein